MKHFPKENNKDTKNGGNIHMMHDHNRPGKHIPPHERRNMMRIEFSEEDLDLFNTIYGDEDEAMAAVRVIMDAPPEIQILAIQLINYIEEVA